MSETPGEKFMVPINTSLRSELRAKAHSLRPVVSIGEAGLSAAVLREIDCGLESHELIKVRVFGDDRQKRVAFCKAICTELGAALIQHIGKLLVLYRPRKAKPK